jgi:hypothetical protein
MNKETNSVDRDDGVPSPPEGWFPEFEKGDSCTCEFEPSDKEKEIIEDLKTNGIEFVKPRVFKTFYREELKDVLKDVLQTEESEIDDSIVKKIILLQQDGTCFLKLFGDDDQNPLDYFLLKDLSDIPRKYLKTKD